MVRTYLAALALAAFAPAPGWTQDKPEDLAALNKRVQKLEAENAALKRDLADVKEALASLLKMPKESLEKATAAEKVKALGTEAADDLVKGRLASVYDMTSAAFRKTTDRKKFDEQMKSNPGFKVFVATSNAENPTQEHRVKAGPKPQKWHYYYTRTASYLIGGTYRVNVAITFIEEGGEWKIDEIDIRRDDS